MKIKSVLLSAIAALTVASLPITSYAQFSRGSSTSSTPSYSAPSRPSTPSPSYSAPSRPSTPAVTPSASPRPTVSTPPATPTIPQSPPTVAAQPPASSSGFTRPSATTPQAPLPPVARNDNTPPPQSSQGFSRPGAASVGVGVAAGAAAGLALTPSQPQAAEQRPTQQQTTTPPPPSAITDAQRRSMSADSLNAYRAERAAANTPPPRPVERTEVRRDPVYSSARESFRTPDLYMQQRENSYRTYRTQHPQVFDVTRNMSPNYGIFDTNFLTGMVLGVVGTSLYDRATWMASQQSQPWYPQYRADIERQARENSELRYRLAELDREMIRIREDTPSSVAAPVKTLPAGVDPSIAIAPEAVIADSDSDSSSNVVLIIVLVIVAFGIAVAGGLIYVNRKL